MWVEAISRRSMVPVDALWRIARSASRRYYEFPIKKTDGTERLIQHPSRSLKALQRLVNRDLVSKAPIHAAATAYEKGSKIKVNAERHLGTKFTTRLDFENYFPSFDLESVGHFFRELSEFEKLGLEETDIDFITRIVCRYGELVIGAPSSPKITNAMMYEFDCKLDQIAQKYSIIYTRYADDIYISSREEGVLSCVEKEIRSIVKDHKKPKLNLKEEKTLHLSTAKHRSLTGLVITPTGEISIGRDRKREIRTLTYLALNKKLNSKERDRLIGLLAFAYDNEPDFVGRLSKKFNVDIISWFKAGRQTLNLP